ncbi:MAG: GNAT family N-acetyltransferase [archaeon]
MSWEIEVLKERDVEESTKALQKSMGNQPGPLFGDAKGLGRAIYGPHAITLIAKKGGSVVGIVSGTATLPPNIAFLGVTDADCAKEGLGGKLIDGFLDEAKKKIPNAPAVRTTLPAEYTDAVALYSSKGFVVEGFVKTAGQGRDIVFLSRSYAQRNTSVA